MTDVPQGSFGSEQAVGLTASRGGFLRATRWTFAMEVGRQGSSLVVSFVLAALLGPKAFGTVAMANIYILFIQMVQQQGMGPALIQRRNLTDPEVNTAFWMVMASSGVLTGISIALAGWWAGVNRLPELGDVVVALSALIPIQALMVVQEALLRRRMAYRALATRTLVGVVVGGIAGVVAAIAGWGIAALVVQQLVTALISLIMLWSSSDWRPSFSWSANSARQLLGFSTGSFLSSLAVFVNNRADALLIGLFFGPVVVGVYRFAGRLVDLLLTTILRSIQSIALPELAPFQQDPAGLRRRLRRLMRLSAVLALPSLGVLAGIAGPAIALLGPSWSGAVLPLRVLCLVGLIRVVIVVNGPLLQALGRPHMLAGVSWIAAFFSATAFCLAALPLRNLQAGEQALGIAVARATIYGFVILALHVYLVRRLAGVSIRSIFGSYAAPLAAGLAASAGGVLGDVLLLAFDLNPAIRLTGTGVASVFLAGGIMYVLDDELRRIVRQALTSRRHPDGKRPAVEPTPLVEAD